MILNETVRHFIFLAKYWRVIYRISFSIRNRRTSFRSRDAVRLLASSNRFRISAEQPGRLRPALGQRGVRCCFGLVLPLVVYFPDYHRAFFADDEPDLATTPALSEKPATRTTVANNTAASWYGQATKKLARKQAQSMITCRTGVLFFSNARTRAGHVILMFTGAIA